MILFSILHLSDLVNLVTAKLQQITLDLSYNQNFGANSHLYFVRENYSVEGGWTESALRSALDGVMQLISHVGAEFKVNNFSFSTDYPRWKTS
ncbi:MAG: hypothetical protein DWQ04_04610 [Chloroflexi bacterium]|nr:MAG: hypothetical protein DWQ04_04610 [Chloroflexota bacterium]